LCDGLASIAGGASQSRIAKIEAGDPSVSLDLIVCALATTRDIQVAFTTAL